MVLVKATLVKIRMTMLPLSPVNYFAILSRSTRCAEAPAEYSECRDRRHCGFCSPRKSNAGDSQNSLETKTKISPCQHQKARESLDTILYTASFSSEKIKQKDLVASCAARLLLRLRRMNCETLLLDSSNKDLQFLASSEETRGQRSHHLQ